MKRIWVALLVFSMMGGAVSANAISFKRKKTKKKESVEKEKTAYDKLFSSNHYYRQKYQRLAIWHPCYLMQ